MKEYFEVKLASFGELYLMRFEDETKAREYVRNYELFEDEENIELRHVEVLDI